MEHIVISPSEAALSAPTGFLVPDTREAIEMAVESFLARLDVLDGDPDLEANGDELDGNGSEDDFMEHRGAGPGCPISDPDAAVDDQGCDDINDDREEDEGVLNPQYGIDQTKGALPQRPSDDLILTRPHRDRIRRTRCEKVVYRNAYHRDFVEWRLPDPSGEQLLTTGSAIDRL